MKCVNKTGYFTRSFANALIAESMVSATNFWKQQPFHHLITYSFNRGSKLAALYEAVDQTLADLAALPPNSYLQQFKLKRQLRELQAEKEISAHQRRLFNAQGALDSTAEQVALVERDSPIAEQLGKVFRGAGGEVAYAGCMPVFRDALAFYDNQGRLVRTLNICFECLYMETNNKVMVEAGVEVYKALRDLLGQLGHPIEAFGR